MSRRGVIAFWVAYGVAHSAFRLATTHTLTLDDSRANELVQTLSLGYQVRQPPLYEWLLWLSQQALGTGIASHLLVRYGLIAALGVATFGAARAAIRDERWAAAASLSLAFAYPVAWTFHEWATQTILLSIACMLTVHAAIRVAEQPGWRPALFLGFALALGLYAKFSYPLFLAALVLAVLSLREWRGRLADPRLLLSAAIALVAIAPFVLWIVQVKGDIPAEVASHMIDSEHPFGRRVVTGLGRLAKSLVIFLLPWILFVAVLAPAAFRPQRGAPGATAAERLTLATMLFAALLAAAGIAATGATNIAERYMHPILIIAPVYVFARVARLEGADAPPRFAAVALAMAIIVLAVRLVGVTDNALTRGASRALLLPYEQLAAALEQRGIVSGTLITPRVREAGNLRAFLPELRVIAGDSFRVPRAPRREADRRSCVLLWPEGQIDRASRLAPIDGLPVETITVRASRGWIAWREATWSFVRLDPNSAACR